METMKFESIGDAETFVANSGVVEWDWNGRDSTQTLRKLARFLRLHDDEFRTFDDALRAFVRDELGENPREYSL